MKTPLQHWILEITWPESITPLQQGKGKDKNTCFHVLDKLNPHNFEDFQKILKWSKLLTW